MELEVTIVTAASSNHFRSLQQFLSSVPSGPRVIVYDIGLTSAEASQIPSIVPFDFDAYPDFVRLASLDAGAYAWKPAIIHEVCSRATGIVIWCDAGNIIQNLPELVRVIKHCGVYSAISSGSFRRWTHPTACSHLPKSDTFLDRQMRNAACVGIDLSAPRAREFVNEWKSLALRKEISLPDGASRSNHRHDQSILTYLLYMYGFVLNDNKVGHTIHNDVE